MSQLMYWVPATGSPFTPSNVSGTTITVSSTSNLTAGMYVESATYNINTTISSITNLTQFVVASATNITTSTPLNIGTWVTAVVGAQGAQGAQGTTGAQGAQGSANNGWTTQSVNNTTVSANEKSYLTGIFNIYILPSAPANGTTNIVYASTSVTIQASGTDVLQNGATSVGSINLSTNQLVTCIYNSSITTWIVSSNNSLGSNSSGLIGTLAVANGGLNATTTAIGSIPLGSSTSAYTPLAIGTNGQVLTSNGTTATWATSSGGGGGTNGSGSINNSDLLTAQVMGLF